MGGREKNTILATSQPRVQEQNQGQWLTSYYHSFEPANLNGLSEDTVSDDTDTYMGYLRLSLKRFLVCDGQGLVGQGMSAGKNFKNQSCRHPYSYATMRRHTNIRM